MLTGTARREHVQHLWGISQDPCLPLGHWIDIWQDLKDEFWETWADTHRADQFWFDKIRDEAVCVA